MSNEPNPDWMPLFSERNGLGGRIKAWHQIAAHPFFKDCYEQEGGSLIDAMLAKLDRYQALVKPDPVTFAEFAAALDHHNITEGDNA